MKFNGGRIIKTKFIFLILMKLVITGSLKIKILSSQLSSITLKIKPDINGYITVYKKNNNEYCDSMTTLDEIYINGIKQSGVSNKYISLINENNVILIWRKTVYSASCLFLGCSEITEIDFSSFDASQITKMHYMLANCSSLESINFSKFNTSKVTDMRYMFYNCYSLKQINLSSFDTSKVTRTYFMFYGCISLKTLNVSNFDTSVFYVS